MLREMLTDTETESKLDPATHTATSSHTAADCFTEGDSGAATHAAQSLNTTSVACRFVAS